MTDVQNCFISLIRNVVIGIDLPKDFKLCDLSELYKLSKKQDMAHIIAYGLKKNNLIDLNSDLWKKCFNKQYSIAQFRVMNLEYEFKKVCSVLEKEKVDYIPLKGIELRQLYPTSWMRTSSDIDILIHETDLQKAEQHLIQKLGYSIEYDDHPTGKDDALITKNGFKIELHFALTWGEGKIAKILNTVWDNVRLKEEFNHRYIMENGFFYFYHIYHAYKHFIGGGCGVRTIVDTWLINNKLKISSKCCCEWLKETNLESFASLLENLAEQWMDNVTHKDCNCIEEYILSGGVHGGSNFTVAGNSKTNNAVTYYLKRMFPTYSYMCGRYRELKRKPFLLPYYWLKRIVTALNKRNRKRTRNEVKTAWLEKEKSKKIKAMFDELGL